MPDLHWHKWQHKRGTLWLLFTFPQRHANSMRSTGETAIVRRQDTQWRAETCINGFFRWSLHKSPVTARKWVEQTLDKASITLFGSDTVTFTMPEKQS